jgi:hypothetical protein
VSVRKLAAELCARRPRQRRFGVPTPGRLHQRQQRRHQAGIGIGGRLAATTGTADPAQRRLPGLQLGHPSWTRDREAPEARATAAIPPCPSDRASPASTSRAERSSRWGSTASNFALNEDSTSAGMAIHHQQPRNDKST